MSKPIELMDDNFTQFPNGALTDQKLSNGATRVFIYLCSKINIKS